ncbi:hypothetical protein QN219_14385 [Sinorhizobium sp. 7-81]|uniref:hypothetical protein n=1 Tax=Sinorhizobium sp. 8-89 TaxID=3049089 RepID=UPI0024C277B1|nr:hypothetical protein [Sinorhizobium sp. 8-89]MDK1491242.1 hypothetical protein [Sinorhizobium sp. 8-89]
MAVAYSVGPIKREQVDKSYRLVEAVGYHLDLPSWREYCAISFARNWPAPYAEEVITVENPLGYIVGLCIIRPAHDKIYGRVLDVPVFIVISAADTRGASSSLLGYLTATARNKHYGFIRVWGLEPDDWPGSPDVSRGEGRGILIPVQ